MLCKWIGAILILTGCGTCGIYLAGTIRQEERMLRELTRLLQLIESELEYRLTPVPELLDCAQRDTKGVFQRMFSEMKRELERKISPNVFQCMQSVINRYPSIPEKVRHHLLHLSRSLGRYDLEGQLRGLRAIGAACNEELTFLRNSRENRIRSYCTLGFCSGTALVILFI